MTLGEALTLIGVLFAILCGVLAYLWRRMDHRIDELTKLVHSISTQEVLAVKIERLQQDYNTLHLWKNSIFTRDMERLSITLHGILGRVEADLNRRLERIERRLNGDRS